MTQALDQQFVDAQPAQAGAEGVVSVERTVRLSDSELLAWAQRLYAMHQSGGGFLAVKVI